MTAASWLYRCKEHLESEKKEEKKDITVSLYLWKYFYSYKKGDRMPQSQIQGYSYITIEF